MKASKSPNSLLDRRSSKPEEAGMRRNKSPIKPKV